MPLHPHYRAGVAETRAGKSTSAGTPARGALEVHEFVNADTIAAGLSAYRPEAVADAQWSAVIRGMRIAVKDVFEYLAGGMTVDEVLSDFPELTREDVEACFAFAAAQAEHPTHAA